MSRDLVNNLKIATHKKILGFNRLNRDPMIHQTKNLC